MSAPQKLSVEKLIEIWDDDKGYHFEVGPDRDGLDLLELRYYELKSVMPDGRITMTAAEARAIGQALIEASHEPLQKLERKSVIEAALAFKKNAVKG